jgi:hypothetical protein
LAGSGGHAGHGGHGGSGIVPDADADESGSRLQLLVVQGTDGSQVSQGFFMDTQRHERCSFQLVGVSSYACLPVDGIAQQALGYYGDSGCSQPIATYASTCSGPTPLYVQSFVPCGISLSQINGAISGNVYAGSPASCTAVSPTQQSQLGIGPFYHVGATVPASSFVAGTITTP